MGNHPNRKRSKGPARNPTKTQIQLARHMANLTQTEAAALLYTTCRVWQQWEAGDRRMHPAFWELFKLKCST